MELTVTPGQPLHGTASLPGDKSLSHRAALLAALAEGESCIENFLVSGVTQAMLGALTAFGVAWELQGTTLRVEGKGLDGLRQALALRRPVEIDCGNSATTLRLLAGAVAALGVPAVLDGSTGLRRRPMHRIVAPLRSMGASVTASDGCAPLVFHSTEARLRALEYELPVASAQVKSCLLLAALAADGPTTLIEPGPSRDHTERMLRSLGIGVISRPLDDPSGGTRYLTRLAPGPSGSLPPLRLALPGDFSSAAFLIVAAAITPGSEVTLQGVGLNPTRTGLIDALQAMGADIQAMARGDRSGEPVGDLRVRYALLRGGQVSGPLVVRMIDEFPAFAVAAAFAHGQTVVSEAEELRHKESDRIAALCGQLRGLGVAAAERENGFIIRGGDATQGGRAPCGGRVDSCGDHRLAMALAAAGLASAAPVIVMGAEIIAESFPGYVETLRSLGAQVSVH